MMFYKAISEEEHDYKSNHKPIINVKDGLVNSIPNSKIPYYYVQIDDDVKYLHVIEE